MTRFLQEHLFGVALVVLVGCGSSYCSSGQSGGGRESTGAAAGASAAEGSSGAVACTKHQDCRAGTICVTLTHCEQGSCTDIPNTCNDTATCGCIQEPICGTDTCIDRGQCFVCTSPPGG